MILLLLMMPLACAMKVTVNLVMILAIKLFKINFFRHLRFVIKSAENAIANPPTLPSLSNTVAAQGAEIKAIKAQLATTTEEKDRDFAQQAEEADGRLNEE